MIWEQDYLLVQHGHNDNKFGNVYGKSFRPKLEKPSLSGEKNGISGKNFDTPFQKFVGNKGTT